MAGDWLKMGKDLPDKPEVWQIAARVSIDPDSVVGKLLRVWSWFDSHTEDGNAHGVSFALVDRVAGVNGFAEAMFLAGWLIQQDMTLSIPKFDRHNGKTAKNRALTNERVAKHRAESNADSNAESVTPSVTKTVTREEKRREELSTTGVVESMPRKRGRPPSKTAMPADFVVSERVRLWAAEKGFDRLDEHLDAFRLKAAARSYTYADWDAAFMEAVREDWAKLRVTSGPGAMSKPDRIALHNIAVVREFAKGGT